jgi:hypothetical protein
MTTVPLPHSVSGGVVVVVVGVVVVSLGVVVVSLGLEVVVSLGLLVVVLLGLSPPEEIQPLATTLKTKTPTKSRANNPFFISLSPA